MLMPFPDLDAARVTSHNVNCYVDLVDCWDLSIRTHCCRGILLASNSRYIYILPL